MNKQRVVKTFTYKDGYHNLGDSVFLMVEDSRKYMQEEVEILLRTFAESQTQYKEVVDVTFYQLPNLFAWGGEIEGDVITVTLHNIKGSWVTRVVLNEIIRISEMVIVYLPVN